MNRRVLVVVIAVCVATVLTVRTGAQFTDDPIVAGVTIVRAVHINELRVRINSLRSARGLSVFVYTDSTLSPGATPIRAAHIAELRTALAQVYAAAGLPPPTYTDAAITAQATRVRAVHINELRAAVTALENQGPGGTLPVLSPGVVTTTNVSVTGFNNTFATVELRITNEVFSTNPNHVYFFRNGLRVPNASLKISAAAIAAPGVLVEGANVIELLARDSQGRLIDYTITLWAGTATLNGRIVNDSGQGVANATVVARIGSDPEFGATRFTSSTGDFSFTGVPDRTITLASTAPNLLAAAASVRGNAGFVQLQAKPIAAPSPINNNDFSQGTAGWNIGTAPVQLIAHSEGFAGNGAVPSADDTDLVLNTQGEGSQRIFRTFVIAPGTTNVTLRYRFITSEVPGGFFGTEFDDSFSVVVRNQAGAGIVQEIATMNGLGLGAFNAGGATAWRETSLPVSVNGDVFQAEFTVANVADGLYDSQLVIDLVAEKKVAITQLTLNDIDNVKLKFLSADSHPYFNGITRIHGTVTVQGPSDDGLASLTLEVIQGGAVKATATLAPALNATLLTSFGAAEKVQVTSSQLLFELTSAQGAGVNGTADSSLSLRARARTQKGQEVTFDAGVVQLLVRFTGTNRYGERNESEGGDDWAQPGFRAIANHFTGNLYGDFSNMNGGKISPHAEHTTGEDVDGWFNGYNSRNAATAAVIIGHLNTPTYGSQIGRVLVAFDPGNANDTFWNAIKTVKLADGRLASDVIIPDPAHTGHFHWDRGAAAAAPSAVPAAVHERRARAR